ncbi:MAG: hypothetical protein ACW99A_18015, partial [Candidatus Kariarchaeaceae archaeon]
MGLKSDSKFILIIVILLITSTILPTTVQSEADLSEEVEEDQVLLISTFQSLNESISPFNTFGFTQELVLTPIGASLYTKYAPKSKGVHDYIPQ